MVKLTAILGFIGFLQLIVFGMQAHRLQQTIVTMKELGNQQSADMQSSIAIAKQSADAAKTSAEVAKNAAEALPKLEPMYFLAKGKATIYEFPASQRS